jgi:hypothetical protein
MYSAEWYKDCEDELEKKRKESDVAYILRHNPSICLKGLRKATTNLIKVACLQIQI